jgi:membrane-bound lytic murein transglycosylase F
MANSDRDGAVLLNEAPLVSDFDPQDVTAEVVVATRLGPSTWVTDPDGRTTGVDHDLAQDFARSLGHPVRFLVLDNLQQVLSAVRNHRAHFAAAAVPVTPELGREFGFSQPYGSLTPEVVSNPLKAPVVHSFKELDQQTLALVPNPVHLKILQEAKGQSPHLSWREYPRGGVTQDLMEKVSVGSISYLLADSDWVANAQSLYPELQVSFRAGPQQPVAWAFPKTEGAQWLYQSARSYLDRLGRSGELERIASQAFGNTHEFNRENSVAMLEGLKTRLPALTRIFKKAESLSSIDWRLLAAVAWQESQWNNNAVSPTGVRGVMMLTEDTALRLKVRDRLNPEEAIPAAALYLKELHDSLPPSIKEPDRTWMALAAYNVGVGHLEDARVLAQKNRMSPNSWNDLKVSLPLLSHEGVYENTRLGFARGGEPVHFVEEVRGYYRVIANRERPYRIGRLQDNMGSAVIGP